MPHSPVPGEPGQLRAGGHHGLLGICLYTWTSCALGPLPGVRQKGPPGGMLGPTVGGVPWESEYGVSPSLGFLAQYGGRRPQSSCKAG